MKLPINKNQKFQIGDICRIVRADNSLRYPPIKDKETEGYGCLVVIMHSYAQCFPHMNPSNSGDLEVYLPQWLNPQMYDGKGWYKGKAWSCQGEFSWSWVSESQLEFVRKPTDEEIEKIIAFGEKTRWAEYKEKNPYSWIWGSYADLLEHSQEKIDAELNKLFEAPSERVVINFVNGLKIVTTLEEAKECFKGAKLVYEKKQPKRRRSR